MNPDDEVVEQSSGLPDQSDSDASSVSPTAAPVNGDHDDNSFEHEDDEEEVVVIEPEPEDDPFSSGVFDLEHGAPVQHSEQGETLPWRSYIDNAKDFFNAEILYRFDILGKKDRDLLIGKYRLELKGFRGGVWTVSIDPDITVVNRREEADVVIAMQQHDFIQLINGELNPQLAVVAEKIKITGDVRRAIGFQKVLAPSGHDQ